MKHTLTLKTTQHEAGDIHSFTFEPDDKVAWKAGQYALFTMKDFKGDGKPSRTFTIASAPCEDGVMFSTRIGDVCSDFKTQLKGMEAGDTLTMNGPYGKMCIDDPEQPILMLAGGIGITPFRSLMMDMDATLERLPFTSLLYNNSEGNFAFYDTLDTLNQKHPDVHVHFIEDRETCANEIKAFVDEYKNKGLYLISGSPGFVNAMEKTLTDQGIEKDRMKHDPFYGY